MYVEDDKKKLLESKKPCPFENCNSSDGFFIWQKGEKIDGYCFSCGQTSYDPYNDLIRSEGNKPTVSGPSKFVTNSTAHSPPAVSTVSVEDGLDHPIRGIPDRGISYSTAEYYSVRIGVSPTDGETPVYTLFPRHREGNLVGFKTRTKDKQFFSSGGNEVELFGSHQCKSQGKKLYITEGEYDALSVFQALKEGSTIPGYNPSVVSLPSGATSVVKSLSISSALLDGYQEIVLVFDNDEHGTKARDLVCKAFAGKVSYVTIPHPYKDANDMLMAGKSNDLKWLCLTHARKYQPDGILTYSQLKDKFKNRGEKIFYPYPDWMPELNRKVYGAKPGTIVTITSGTGSGKTQFLRELIKHFNETTNEKQAALFLEEDSIDTVEGLISLDLNKRIMLPDINDQVSEEDKDESFDRIFSDNRITVYDFFGGMDDSSLLSKLNYFANTGHKFIYIDHLSIIVSEHATEGDERKKIDVMMTKLAKFAKINNIVLFLVVHLKKPDSYGKSFEQGGIPSLDDLRGSASLKQLSWEVFGLSRDQQHPSPYCANTTLVTVLKIRLSGRTGPADYLHFNEVTGRMLNVEKPEGYIQVKGIKRGNI